MAAGSFFGALVDEVGCDAVFDDVWQATSRAQAASGTIRHFATPRRIRETVVNFGWPLHRTRSGLAGGFILSVFIMTDSNEDILQLFWLTVLFWEINFDN